MEKNKQCTLPSARVKCPIKDKIKEAASIEGISVSAFVVLHSLKAAKKIIKNN